MNKPAKKCVGILGLAMILLLFSITTPVFANSAAPPSVVIIVNNPPSDLQIELAGNN